MALSPPALIASPVHCTHVKLAPVTTLPNPGLQPVQAVLAVLGCVLFMQAAQLKQLGEPASVQI